MKCILSVLGRRSLVAFILFGFAFAFIAGCEQEPIQTYRVERPKSRLLGAMIPRGDKVWFVKITGSAEAMADVEPAFDAFLASIKLKDDAAEPISWTLPSGWQSESRRVQMRYATLRAPMGLELTVSVMPGGQSKLGNVNRWRKQMGLSPIKEGDLKNVCRDMEIGGVKNATRIDMTGAANEHAKAAVRAIEYEAPKDWKRVPNKMADQEAVFRAGPAEAAEISITALTQGGGGILENLNRWRRQLGLPKIAEDEATKLVHECNVGDEKGLIVDFTGEQKIRIVGVIVPREERTWFFKIMGPADEVEKVRPEFDAMLRTVRINENE